MHLTKHMTTLLAGMAALLCAASSPAKAAGPQIVSGPSADPACFKPWSDKTKFFKWAKKPGPYRIALANGFIGNTWRIQMIKTAKAYAEQPDVKANIKEFKVISTGEDLAAQIAAVDNFVASGYDAVIVNALSPTAFNAAVKRANAAGVVLISFDNTLDTEDAVAVNVDQFGLGVKWGEWLVKNIPSHSGTLLEVRGVAGNSVDRDRHEGVRKITDAPGMKFQTVEVVGKWDDGTAQKAVADAIAIHKHFDGISVQGGSTGTVQAMIDAGHPFVPVGGETENGFRKLCAAHSKEGLKCASAGTGPAQVAVSIKTAIAALQGSTIPQSISLPLAYVEDPNFVADKDYFPNQADNFFVGNAFPTCGINFTAQEIMGQSQANQ
jgi:ribose transport system substrate-binding protein